MTLVEDLAAQPFAVSQHFAVPRATGRGTKTNLGRGCGGRGCNFETSYLLSLFEFDPLGGSPYT